MKRMKKLWAGCLCLALCASLVAGCGNGSEEGQQAESLQPSGEKVSVRVMAMTGPTGMGMVKLMNDAADGQTIHDYQISLVGASDEITGKMVTGEIDIAAVPCNLASVLYQKTEGAVEVAAVNTLGVLYMLEGNSGQDIQSVADLKGKTIVTTGKGATPEYILNYILAANDLNPETDVTIAYKSEAAEVGALFQTGDVEVAMLPQPFVTSVLAQNDGVRVALDMTEEWAALQEDNTNLVTGTVIVRKAFLEEHKEVVDAFLQEYKASIDYVNQNIPEAAKLMEQYGIVAKAAVAEKAIPACNMVYMTGEEMQKNVSAYLEVLYAANPAAVGGTLPNEDFYYLP